MRIAECCFHPPFSQQCQDPHRGWESKMAWQGNLSRRHNATWLGKTSDLRLLPCCLLDLHNIRKSKRSIGEMKYISMCTRFHFLFGVTSSWFSLLWRPTSVNSSRAALSFWPSRLIMSAMFHIECGIFDSWSLIWVMQQSIGRSHCSGQASCLLMMLMGWAISQMCSLSLLSIHCVVKPPLLCHVPIVSAAHWLTPTPAFSAQTQTGRFGIWILLASVTTDIGNQTALHYIVGSQRWSMIEW